MNGKSKAFPSGWALFFVVLLTASCTPSSEARRGNAHLIAQDAGFVRQSWAHQNLPMVTYHSFRSPTDTLNIYIEGDGYAFASRRKPSDDPTPINPVSLKLALSSGVEAVAYIGRPCQYVTPAGALRCDPIYWTSHRFAPEVVDTIHDVINQLKVQAGASRITLAGYSGGGVIAALIAAKRHDVDHLTTIAAPLSLKSWLAYHNLSPLEGDDPLEQIEKFCSISQVHYWGEVDRVVPVASIMSFVDAVRRCPGARIEIVSGAGHHYAWEHELAASRERALFQPLQH